MALSNAQSKITPALVVHIAKLEGIAEAAYAPYVGRIGKQPAPMDADFSRHISRREIYISVVGDEIEGFIVTYPRADDQFVENIAVSPQSQGAGAGRD